MSRPPPEPVQVVKQRRDAALERMVAAVPYIRHLGVAFDRRGDELTAQLPFSERLVGNPLLPALHGGAIGAFLEIAAIMELAWAQVWELMEGGGEAAATPPPPSRPAASRPSPGPSTSPSTTSAPACPATPTPAPASTAPAAATPRCTSRPGRTTAPASSPRPPAIS